MVRRVMVCLVIVVCLVMVVPSAAQDDAGPARVRFANLVAESSSLLFTGMTAETLADVGPYGAVTDFVEVPTDLTGVGYSLQVGPSSRSGMRAGMDPLFTAGHDYLVLTLGYGSETSLVIVDLTGQFGAAATTAGQGRLLVLYYVGDSPTSSYTLETGTGKVTLFMTVDTDSFDPQLALTAVALTPGDYSITVTDANQPETVILEPTTVTLQEDQMTILVVYGSSAQNSQGYLFSGDELILLEP